MTLTNPTMNPVTLEGYPFGYRPLSDVTSFTYRTGAGLQETLEAIRAWIPRYLIPTLNASFDALNGSIVDDVNNLADAVDDALAANAELVAARMATQNTAVEDFITAKQNDINTQLANTLAGLAGGNISITDPVIHTAIQTAGSQSRILLDQLYATKQSVTDVTQTLANLVGTGGRLSAPELDNAYKVTDTGLAAFIGDPTTNTAQAIAAIAVRASFRLVGTRSQRTALTGSQLFEGLVFYETDTGTTKGRNVYVYESGAWSQTGGDSGWRLSSVSLGSGWNNIKDPDGHVEADGSFAGGVRTRNGQTELRFMCNRQGGALTASNLGNLAPDNTIATVDAAYRPASTVYGNLFVAGTAQGTARIGPDGVIQATDLYPNVTINTGNAVLVGISYLMG